MGIEILIFNLSFTSNELLLRRLPFMEQGLVKLHFLWVFLDRTNIIKIILKLTFYTLFEFIFFIF